MLIQFSIGPKYLIPRLVRQYKIGSIVVEIDMFSNNFKFNYIDAMLDKGNFIKK